MPTPLISQEADTTTQLLAAWPTQGAAVVAELATWAADAWDRFLKAACADGQVDLAASLLDQRPDRLVFVWGQLTWNSQTAAVLTLAQARLIPVESAQAWVGENSLSEVRAQAVWPELIAVPAAHPWLAELADRVRDDHPELAQALTARLRQHRLQAQAVDAPRRTRPRA